MAAEQKGGLLLRTFPAVEPCILPEFEKNGEIRKKVVAKR